MAVRAGTTHHDFTLASKVALLNTDQGVVVLTFPQGCGMYVSGKEADCCEDASVERGLSHNVHRLAVSHQLDLQSGCHVHGTPKMLFFSLIDDRHLWMKTYQMSTKAHSSR